MCAALVRRQRLAWALGGSLLLHVVGLAVLCKGAAPRPLRPPPGSAAAPSPPAMLWVATTATLPPPAVAGGAGAPQPVRPATARAQAVTIAAARGMPKPPATVVPLSPRDAGPEPGAGAPSSGGAAAPVPQPSASGASQPTALGLDDVARALARERAWQRRQRPAGALQPGPLDAPAAAAPGAGGWAHDRRGADGARTAQVAGPWGSYCVELPSTNQPPAMGAAPRIAPPRTCR
ncbi:hypothetical protein [Acidovorax sp.]|uniref:hypothetical protein n=1 Tax=Acidovorax sp. TaxID=1872122 RepID=UPI00260D5520|nr:hypothetical protein [Acidovorax sp.]